MKIRIIFSLFILFCFISIIFSCGKKKNPEDLKIKKVVVDAGKRFQVIDGFGVNITPAQWNNGKLKKVIDQLVDDMGCTIFRFDAYGNGQWLDPVQMNPKGKFPAEYIEKVYREKVFTDAWETFRYLNSKNVTTYFNVSGVAPQAWYAPDRKTLINYNGYAEMQATMLDWARNKENLKFSLHAPFNELDLGGSAEGPYISPAEKPKALASIIKKMKDHGLDDVAIIAYCDATFHPDKISSTLKDTSFVNKIYAFSGHIYGNGDQGDADIWFDQPSVMGMTIEAIKGSSYNKSHAWLTEYGDLDQSGEIEYEFAWRSVRRLLRSLKEGITSAQYWDAFDNYHVHDSAWAQYGLFRTDTTKWTYEPKQRYFALKQVYRFIKPGFKRIDITNPDLNPSDVYSGWKSTLKNIKLLAFISPDGRDFTLVGMSMIESDISLEISLENLPAEFSHTSVHVYRTSRNENFSDLGEFPVTDWKTRIPVSERSIFTITTVR